MIFLRVWPEGRPVVTSRIIVTRVFLKLVKQKTEQQVQYNWDHVIYFYYIVSRFFFAFCNFFGNVWNHSVINNKVLANETGLNNLK